MLRPQSLLVATLVAAASQTALAAPIISPYADDLPSAAYSADATAGGSAESVFNGGYWNAGGHGSHWVQADMGAVFTLSQVRFSVDVMPANTTTQLIFLSDSPIGDNWDEMTPVASRSAHTEQYWSFQLDFASLASGRYLQVVTNGGASWAALGGGSVRSNWIDPAPQPPAVPEPATVGLLMAGLAAVLWRTRQSVAAG
jgi:PEP-CTERM motif